MTFRYRHWRHAAVLGLFVLTGIGLFLTSWRTALGPLLPVVQDVHEAGGIVYGASILVWSWKFFPWPAGGSERAPAYTKWAFFFVIMLAVTGVGLLVGPSYTHAIATVGHAAFAAAFIIWTVWHLLVNQPVRLRQPAVDTPRPDITLSRRNLLRWGAGSLLTIPAVWAAPTMLRLVSGSLLGAAGGSNAGGLPGFVPYTVTGSYPAISHGEWHLTLTGVHLHRTWSWAEFSTEPMRTTDIVFRCVTGWAVDGVRFTGVDLADFLTRQGWKPQDNPWVMFFSGDGVYTESLSAEQILKYRPLIAVAIDGQPLPRAQGYPARLLVPNMYGYKSLKWLVGIHLGHVDHIGYWELRGYPQNAYIGSFDGLPSSIKF